jgi:transcriptional regulator with XRE-family HTH domain
MSINEFNEVFSRRLRYYLERNGMTQLDLARKLGVGATSVSFWCNGTKAPRMDKVDKMCELFHCKRSDLIEDKDSTFPALSQEEKAHMTKYRLLDAADRVRIDERIEILLEDKKYIETKDVG